MAVSSLLLDTAPRSETVSKEIANNVLYLPIAHEKITSIPIKENSEKLADLKQINNDRIIPLETFDSKYATYDGASKIRLGVLQCLLKMLNILPNDIGIAYFEGFRPIEQQKEYFDKKFQENLAIMHDKPAAYLETTKSVSPFINNIPPHCTGAAIDMTLFRIVNGKKQLLDMGKFDTVFGVNEQQETFSSNTSKIQQENRLVLLNAAIKSGLVNYGYEWWHYSYGDKAWAYLHDKQFAIYGLVADKDHPIFLMTMEDYLSNF